MTTFNPTSANLRALETTVQAYEQAILDLRTPGSELSAAWTDFGEYHTCDLCISVDVTMADHDGCARCVLGPEAVGCTRGTTYQEMRRALHAHAYDGLFGRKERALNAWLLVSFRRRLRFILQRAARNGIVLVERKGRG